MRFKKGSKVKVMNKEVPASWNVAEIISQNEHAYNVRYDGCQGVEKVSKRFIKPCLPRTNSLSWVTGDIVEVFDSNSWKVATVSKVLPGGRLLVQPRGSTNKTSVQKENIRGHWSKKVKHSQRHVSSKQVDAFAYRGDNKYVQSNSLNGCYDEMEKRKRKRNGDSEQVNDSDDTDICSVGSCSVPNDDNLLSNSSDGEELEDEVNIIHRLELNAYRSTLEALYASGPLSWEKEALLTNLRINLHISNDEHLTELRHLISSSGAGFS